MIFDSGKYRIIAKHIIFAEQIHPVAVRRCFIFVPFPIFTKARYILMIRRFIASLVFIVAGIVLLSCAASVDIPGGALTTYESLDGDSTTYYVFDDKYSAIDEYVGGDAYNYIINGNYATAFFVLTAMFVLAAIGLMILHYVSQEKTTPAPQAVQKTVIEDIESNLPQI
jgi:hypothetical protein